MKTKLINAIYVTLIFFMLASNCYAEVKVTEAPGIKIIVNGKTSNYSSVPLIVNGHVLLPLRELLINLGVPNDNNHILWNKEEQSITISKDNHKIVLKIGKNEANIDSVSTTLDAPLIIYKNKTYVPVKFVSQSLGKKVTWNSNDNHKTLNVNIDNNQNDEDSSYYYIDEKDEGNRQFDLENYEEAIKHYDKSIELNPNYDLAYYDKGNALINLHRYEEAIKCFDKAIEISTDFSYPYINKGIALCCLGRFKESIKCFDTGLEIEPDNVIAIYNKGRALHIIGKFEEALECYNKVIELSPGYEAVNQYKQEVISLLEK